MDKVLNIMKCIHYNNYNFVGVPNITLPIEYNFTLTTLTCISSGGPATTVTWTRDSVLVSQSTATQQQRLTDTETATYHNLLTINSSNISNYNGTFTCEINNSRGNSNLQSLSVYGEFNFMLPQRLFN